MRHFTHRVNDVVAQGSGQQGEEVAASSLIGQSTFGVLREHIPDEIFERKADAGNGRVRATQAKFRKDAQPVSSETDGQFSEIDLRTNIHGKPRGKPGNRFPVSRLADIYRSTTKGSIRAIGAS